MGRFGGDLMRGLAGMLGGVSEGIDEQEKRKRLDAELELRRQAITLLAAARTQVKVVHHRQVVHLEQPMVMVLLQL